MVTPLPTRIIRNGRIAELHRARKQYICLQSGLPIEPGEYYYSITYAGAGLGGLKFPDHIHVNCIEKYLNANRGSNQ